MAVGNFNFQVETQIENLGTKQCNTNLLGDILHLQTCSSVAIARCKFLTPIQKVAVLWYGTNRRCITMFYYRIILRDI